jgi:hypothetical protein
MRRPRTPAAENELRTLNAELSHAVSMARRRRRVLRWGLLLGALVLALCLLILSSPL